MTRVGGRCNVSQFWSIFIVVSASTRTFRCVLKYLETLVTVAFGVTWCCIVERSGSTAIRMFDLDATWWLVVSFTFGIRTVACYKDPAVTGWSWNSRCWPNKAVFSTAPGSSELDLPRDCVGWEVAYHERRIACFATQRPKNRLQH
jgi:hypothetical protein